MKGKNGKKGQDDPDTMLEGARRNAGVVQHHDSITGTMCRAEEGCAGTDQVIGAHNVLEDYERMLTETISASKSVSSQVLSSVLGHDRQVGYDITTNFGDVLMGSKGDGGDNVILIAHNTFARDRTEGISIQIPLCSVEVRDVLSGNVIPSQVTAEFSISSGIAPHYDFTLSFIATLPAMGISEFLISPSPADQGCGGGDVDSGSSFVRHSSTISGRKKEQEKCSMDVIRDNAMERAVEIQQNNPRNGDVDGWNLLYSNVVEEEIERCKKETEKVQKDTIVVLENDFYSVDINLDRIGLTSITSKSTNVSTPMTHQYMSYASGNQMDAYAFNPNGEATSIFSNSSMNLLASTVAIGPIMSEVWLQTTAQHKTRIRLWKCSDSSVGRRIEIGHRIGVLKPATDLISRFSITGLMNATTFWSEDNGYETIPHLPYNVHNPSDFNDISKHYYPSQESIYLTGMSLSTETEMQLSVALDRSHAVGSVGGELTVDVMQHRRGLAFLGTGETVTLDDVDRIFTETWISYGPRKESNRDRIEMKTRLNHPLQYYFSLPTPGTMALIHKNTKNATNKKIKLGRSLGGGASFPNNIHLQSLRVLPNGGGTLVRLQHLYGSNDRDEEMSATVKIDLSTVLKPGWTNITEVTLTGLVPLVSLKRNLYPTDGGEVVENENGGEARMTGTIVEVGSFELRTFLVVY